MKLREIGTINVNENELDKFTKIYDEHGVLYSVASDSKTIKLYDWDYSEEESVDKTYDDVAHLLFDMFEEFLPCSLSVYCDKNSRITINGITEMLKTIHCEFEEDISERDECIKQISNKNLELTKENGELKKKIFEYNVKASEIKSNTQPSNGFMTKSLLDEMYNELYKLQRESDISASFITPSGLCAKFRGNR